jgi:hypothetical protein
MQFPRASLAAACGGRPTPATDDVVLGGKTIESEQIASWRGAAERATETY